MTAYRAVPGATAPQLGISGASALLVYDALGVPEVEEADGIGRRQYRRGFVEGKAPVEKGR